MLPEATEDGTPITSINASVFKGNTSIKNVIFPSSYKTLPTYAFSDSALISVDLSRTQITEIPDYAFYRANLTSINLPEGLIRIGKYAFYNSTFPSINLPESLQILDNYALWGIQIKSIYIPKNVTTIGISTIFSYNLQQIVVDEENTSFYDIENSVLASYGGDLILVARQSNLTNLTIPEDITAIKTNCFLHVYSIKSINIGQNLSTIEVGAFENFAGLQTISVDSNNTSFASENDNILYDKARTSIYLVTNTLITFIMPDTLTSAIAKDVFTPAQTSLQYVTLNKTIKDISFLNICSKIKNITIPSGNTNFSTDNRAIFSSDGKTIIKYFGGNSATTYTVPDGVTKINEACFNRSILQSVILPEGLIEIGPHAFYVNSSLSSINIPDTVTTLGYNVFDNTKLISFIFSSNITSVSTGIFYNATKLTNIEFYNSTIPYQTCINCISLKTVVIGENVTTIGAHAFNNCKALESVEFQGKTPPTLASSNVFINTNSTFKIYVPDSAVNTYKSAQYFSQYASQIYPISSKA